MFILLYAHAYVRLLLFSRKDPNQYVHVRADILQFGTCMSANDRVRTDTFSMYDIHYILHSA